MPRPWDDDAEHERGDLLLMRRQEDAMANYPDDMLTSICNMLLDEDWPQKWVSNLALDLPGEYEAMVQNRAEAAWEARSEPDDTAYRRDMKAAGRGHLLRR